MIFNYKAVTTKINAGIIKIPTIIGMGILLLGLVGGVFLVTQSQILKSKASVSSQPKNVNTVNINDTSISFYWQTDEPTAGFIQTITSAKEKNIYRDDRDLSSPQLHKLHFVTLTNLQPDTTYSYQIYSGTIAYPPTPLNFKTAPKDTNIDWPPIVGTIIDTGNLPIDEAIVALNLPQAQKLATITKIGGNFILPISDIKTADLVNSFPTDQIYKAKLDVLGTSKNAQASILIPPQSTALPPIILGTNINLIQIAPKNSSTSAEANKFDLNNDEVINFADLSIILQNFGPVTSDSKNPKADLNNDKTIDQKDSSLLVPYLK